MAINIYTVKADALSKNWEVLSETYKNLKTPLIYKCPKGHIVEITYEKWRKRPECLVCEEENQSAIFRNEIKPRNPNIKYRTLSLDLATNTTGWSIYDDKILTSYGTFQTMAILPEDKIHQVKEWLKTNLKIWQPDIIGIEDIFYKQNIMTFKVLAALQGVIVDFLLENGYKYKIASPSTWREFIGINHAEERGLAKKSAQQWVLNRFKIKATQDEADAISMGQYFSKGLFNMTNVDWGEGID